MGLLSWEEILLGIFFYEQNIQFCDFIACDKKLLLIFEQFRKCFAKWLWKKNIEKEMKGKERYQSRVQFASKYCHQLPITEIQNKRSRRFQGNELYGCHGNPKLHYGTSWHWKSPLEAPFC